MQPEDEEKSNPNSKLVDTKGNIDKKKTFKSHWYDKFKFL